jgi:hypothetical protein
MAGAIQYPFSEFDHRPPMTRSGRIRQAPAQFQFGQLVIKIRVDQIHNNLKFRCERNKDPPSDPNYTVDLWCAEPAAYET